MVIALSMMFAGIFLVAASALLMVARASMLNWLVPLAIGGLVCIAGFVLLMTELMEASLSRGQRALVDGLQAG
jgi:hypothetical protein